ncbi:MAG: hypothetical protein AAF823_02530 [Planctomycetota bacterium]
MNPFIYLVGCLALALTSTISIAETLIENVDSSHDRAISLKVSAEVLHPISPMLFGQFMEDAKYPNGRGEWGPQSTEALNDDGSLRPIVRDLLAELHAPIIRFPGGFMIENANERYDYRIWLPGRVKGLWLEDSVPLKLERRRYGLIQFFVTCERIDAEPLVVVPTKPVFQGQWTVEQAAEFAAGLVAFSNVDTPEQGPQEYRAWVDARRQAGHEASAGVNYWQIGNEIWYYKRTM